MQDILAFLNQAKKPNVQSQDILNYILTIQKSVNKGLLSSQEKDVEDILKQIWDFFFTLIQHNSISIQNAIIRCTNLFLIRNYSFFPGQFEKLLQLQIKERQKISIEKSKPNSQNSIKSQTENSISNSDEIQNGEIEFDNAYIKYDNLILNIFTFIAPKISAMRIDGFLERCKMNGLLSLFTMKGNSSIYSSAPIYISRLKTLDFEWHNDLLTQFLSKPIDFQQIKIVNSIIDNFPSLFPRILETKNYSLISYILSIHSNPSSLSNLLHQRYINLNNFTQSEIILQALEKSTSVSEIDNLLTILNFDSNVSLTIQGEDVTFTTKNQFSQTIKLKKLIDRSAFYNFSDIPIEYLIPNETDSFFILSTKFQRIALKTDVNICKDTFKIFNDFLFGKANSTYDEKNSACLQNLPLCINIFGTLPEFPFFLKKIVLVEPISWVHASDITAIISSLNSVHFPILGGLSAIITKLFTFALSFNTQLSNNAINAIVRISDVNNLDQILTVIYYNIDDFDVHNLTISFKLLSKIVKRNKIYLSTLTTFFERAVEIALLYQFNLDVLQVIFQFIGTIKNKTSEVSYSANSFILDSNDKENLKTLKEIAVSFIYTIMKFFTGSHPIVLNQKFQLRIDSSISMFQNYIDSNEIENINFSLLFHIFSFLRAFPSHEYSNLPFLLFDNLINVFPEKISKFAIQFQDVDGDLETSLYKAFVYFSDKKDIEVGSIWCNVYLRLMHSTALNRQFIDKVNPVFENMATFAFSHPLQISKMCVCTFAFFIMTCSPNKNNLPALIQAIDNNEIRKSILSYLYTESTDDFLLIFKNNKKLKQQKNRNSDDYSEDDDEEDEVSEIDRDSDSEDFLIQEDRTLSFYNVTQSDLLNYKCPLEFDLKSFKNYLIQTQLKFNLVSFDLNQLKMLTRTYLNLCDYESLWGLILYCFRHCRDFPFNEFYDDFLLTPFKSFITFFCSQNSNKPELNESNNKSIVSRVSNEFINRAYEKTKNPPIEIFDQFLYYYDSFVNGYEIDNSGFSLLQRTRSIDNRSSANIPSEFSTPNQNQQKGDFSNRKKFKITLLYDDSEVNLESLCATTQNSTEIQKIYTNILYSPPLINSDFLSYSQMNLMRILTTIKIVLELLNISDSISIYLNLQKPSKKPLKRILFCIPFINLSLLRNDVDLLEFSLYSIRKSDKMSHLRLTFLILANSVFRLSKSAYKIEFKHQKQKTEMDQKKRFIDGKNFIINETFVETFSIICNESKNKDLLPLDEAMLCIRYISEEIRQHRYHTLLAVIKSFNPSQLECCSPTAHNLVVSNLLFVTKSEDIELTKQWSLYNQSYYKKIPSYFRRATQYLSIVISLTYKIQNYQSLKNPLQNIFEWRKELISTFKSDMNQLLTIFNDFDEELSVSAYRRLDEVKRKQHLQLIPSNQNQSTFTAVVDDKSEEEASNEQAEENDQFKKLMKNAISIECSHNFFIDDAFHNCMFVIVHKSTNSIAISAIRRKFDLFLINQKAAEFQRAQKVLPYLIDHFAPPTKEFKMLSNYVYSLITKHKIATVSFHRNKFPQQANIVPSKNHIRHSSLNFASIMKKSKVNNDQISDNSNSDSRLLPDLNDQSELLETIKNESSLTSKMQLESVKNETNLNPEMELKPTQYELNSAENNNSQMPLESKLNSKMKLYTNKDNKLKLESNNCGLTLRRSQSLTYFTFGIDSNFDLTNGTIEASGYNVVNTSVLPTYIKCLSKIIQLNETPNDVVSRVTDNLLEWLRECNDFNSVHFSSYLLQWIYLVSHLSGPEHALNLACTTFTKFFNHFFPLFSAIVIFIDQFKAECKEKNNPNEKEKNIATFDMFKTLLLSTSESYHCKAHSYALQLLANEQHMKYALDLAQFDEDCDESNNIIALLEQTKK